MSRDNWVSIVTTIAMVIAQVVVAVISVRMKPRSDQPTPTPDASQPPKQTQRNGGWVRGFLDAPWWWPLPLILVNLYFLTLKCETPDPSPVGQSWLS